MKTSAEEYLREFKKLQDGTIKKMIQIPSDEPRFIIDSNTRKITIPDDFTFLGVKNDSYAETIYFEVDRYFDSEDLSKHTIVVQYCDNSTPPAESDYPIGIDAVTDIDVDTVPGKIIFGWTIKNEVTFLSTEIAFSVRFYTVDEETSRFSYSLNTLTSTLPVLDTLNISQAAAQRYANILDEWLRRMQNIQNYIDSLNIEVLEGKAEEAVNSAKAAKDALASIDTKTSDSIKQIEATETTSVSNIQKKTEESLASIPDDYKTSFAELKEKAKIDDTAIGSDAWSSRHIIDMLCPKVEKSGNPVQISDIVVGYPLNVTASWEPTQSGSGDPSPENIRPIIGRNRVKVERCGENVVPYPHDYSSTNFTITANEDGELHIKGTVSTNVSARGNIVYVTPGTYTIYSSTKLPDNVYISLTENDVETIILNKERQVATGQLSGATEMVIYVDKGTFDFKAKIVAVHGSSQSTGFPKYTGQTTTLTLPSTVYGGSVNAVTGDCKKPWLEFNNSSAGWSEGARDSGWTKTENSVPWYFLLSNVKNANPICNVLKSSKNIVSTIDTYVIGGFNDYIAIRLPRSVASTGKEVINWLVENNAQIVYDTIKPKTISVDGSKSVLALDGINTIMTDADSVTVTGRADPIKRITALEESIKVSTTTE